LAFRDSQVRAVQAPISGGSRLMSLLQGASVWGEGGREERRQGGREGAGGPGGGVGRGRSEGENEQARVARKAAAQRSAAQRSAAQRSAAQQGPGPAHPASPMRPHPRAHPATCAGRGGRGRSGLRWRGAGWKSCCCGGPGAAGG
jgi:hypothetical protein